MSLKDRIFERLAQAGHEDISKDYPGENLHSIHLSEIAETTGTSVHWLLTGEPDPWEVKIISSCNPYPFDD